MRHQTSNLIDLHRTHTRAGLLAYQASASATPVKAIGKALSRTVNLNLELRT